MQLSTKFALFAIVLTCGLCFAVAVVPSYTATYAYATPGCTGTPIVSNYDMNACEQVDDNVNIWQMNSCSNTSVLTYNCSTSDCALATCTIISTILPTQCESQGAAYVQQACLANATLIPEASATNFFSVSYYSDNTCVDLQTKYIAEAAFCLYGFANDGTESLSGTCTPTNVTTNTYNSTALTACTTGNPTVDHFPFTCTATADPTVWAKSYCYVSGATTSTSSTSANSTSTSTSTSSTGHGTTSTSTSTSAHGSTGTSTTGTSTSAHGTTSTAATSTTSSASTLVASIFVVVAAFAAAL